MKKVALSIVFILILAGVYYAAMVFATSKKVVHEVVLTESGFEPETITISKNDSVRFSTARATQFWPASNEHPLHGEYPEFDPKRPLRSDEVWEFTFTEMGRYEFHDHMYSFYRGVVVVE